MQDNTPIPEPGDGPPQDQGQIQTQSQGQNQGQSQGQDQNQGQSQGQGQNKNPSTGQQQQTADSQQPTPIPGEILDSPDGPGQKADEQIWDQHIHQATRFGKTQGNMPGDIESICFAIDVSGSLDPEELAVIRDCTETIEPETVRVVQCDQSIRNDDIYDATDLPERLETTGGSGTDYRPVLQLLDPEPPEFLIYMADSFASPTRNRRTRSCGSATTPTPGPTTIRPSAKGSISHSSSSQKKQHEEGTAQ